jgi:hypothetical protein
MSTLGLKIFQTYKNKRKALSCFVDNLEKTALTTPTGW